MTTPLPQTPVNGLSEDTTTLLLLGAALVTLVVLLVLFISNKKCRVWALGALVLVLGYLAYLGHHEHVKHFANRTKDAIGPLLQDLKTTDSGVYQGDGGRGHRQ